MRRQIPDPHIRTLSHQNEYSSVKTLSSSQPSRRTSLSYASNKHNEYASRRSSLLLHRRHGTLLKITEENFAMLDRINTQKAVIKFKKSEPKPQPVFKILNFFKNKENFNTRHLDKIISKKKMEIDRTLKGPLPKLLYF